MSEYDMGDDELILAGYDDDLGDDESGARRRRAPGRGRAMARVRPAQRRAAALRAAQPDADGMPLDQIMPFPVGTFTALVSALNLVATPQRAFQLRRLVIDLGRIGASATGIVQVTQLTVGADPQFVQTGSVPAAMFQATAVGIFLKPNAARPGVTITLALSLTGALIGADSIVVSAAGVGPALA